jgi:hypothetical protein
MSIVQTGDLHVYVADLVGMILYYSRAAVAGGPGPAMGYDRPYIRIDLNAVWAVAPNPPLLLTTPAPLPLDDAASADFEDEDEPVQDENGDE